MEALVCRGGYCVVGIVFQKCGVVLVGGFWWVVLMQFAFYWMMTCSFYLISWYFFSCVWVIPINNNRRGNAACATFPKASWGGWLVDGEGRPAVLPCKQSKCGTKQSFFYGIPIQNVILIKYSLLCYNTKVDTQQTVIDCAWLCQTMTWSRDVAKTVHTVTIFQLTKGLCMREPPRLAVERA